MEKLYAVINPEGRMITASLEVKQDENNYIEITEEKRQELYAQGYKNTVYQNGEFVFNELPPDPEKQAKAFIQSELEKVYIGTPENPTPLLFQELYRPVKDAVSRYFITGEYGKVLQILAEAKEQLPDPVKPIAQAIYDKYIELKGE